MPRKKVVTKICPKCGYETTNDDIYCEVCGTLLVEKSEVKAEKKEEVKEVVVEKQIVYQKSPLINYILTAILCLIIGATGVLIYLDLVGTNSETGQSVISKSIEIKDEGISTAVQKVYDSVVVVENLKGETLQGTGTGFVYKKDKSFGYILTNAHVVEGGNKFYVTFTDKNRVEATVVGSDSYSDVALLKVDAKNVKAVAEIGETKDLRLGDTAFAIGAPLDYQVYSWSVTRGIISGTDRLVEVSVSNSQSADYVLKVLQTDAAINNGNSGGPLCNANGQVVGITNMKLASSAIEGMGFAIYIEDAVQYAEMFINGKTIQRPYLGIAMYDLSSLKNNFFFGTSINTDLTSGVYVQTVEDKSSAAKAGLKSGDIITAIDKEEVTSAAYLRYILYKHKIGDTITVTYYRNNQKQTAKVKLEGNGQKS